MATYTKSLKQITIKTLGGQTITVADTTTAPSASQALAEFENFQTMHTPVSGNTVLIPFHAVETITVELASASVEKDDPYGCDETDESEGGGN